MGAINSRSMDFEQDPGLTAILQYLIRRFDEFNTLYRNLT